MARRFDFRLTPAFLLLILAGCDGARPTSVPRAKGTGTGTGSTMEAATRLEEPSAPGEEKPAQGASAPPSPPTAPAKPVVGWTLDPAAMHFPEAPVAGQVNRQPFRLDRAWLGNRGSLRLIQGKDIPFEKEVHVFLLQPRGQSLAGKTFEARPDTGPGAPPVAISWKEGNDFRHAPFNEKYSLKIEFGREADGRLPGKVYLGLPDEAKSWVAGTFTADVEPDYTQPLAAHELPGIRGKITLTGRDNYNLVAGVVGVTPEGRVLMNLTGTTIDPKVGTAVHSEGQDRQVTLLAQDLEDGCFCRHVRLDPGRYLAFVRLDDRLLDWHWVDVKPKAEVNLTFTIDPTSAGRLEVVLPKDAKEKLRLLPLSADGNLPGGKDAVEWFGDIVKADAPVENGKVRLDGLRPGSYRAVIGAVQKDVTVKAKETVTLDLSGAK